MREWLKKLREEKKYSQQFVAERLGISKQYYQMIEAGIRVKDINTSLVMGLAAIFEISAVEILQYEQKHQSATSEKSTTHTA